jgi:hypothetical protein
MSTVILIRFDPFLQALITYEGHLDDVAQGLDVYITGSIRLDSGTYRADSSSGNVLGISYHYRTAWSRQLRFPRNQTWVWLLQCSVGLTTLSCHRDLVPRSAAVRGTAHGPCLLHWLFVVHAMTLPCSWSKSMEWERAGNIQKAKHSFPPHSRTIHYMELVFRTWIHRLPLLTRMMSLL